MRKRLIGLVLACLALSLCVLFVGCNPNKGDNSSPSNSTEEVELTTWSINKSKLALEKHETFQLKVGNDDFFTWSSTDESVATIGDDGTVTALSAGMTIIKATGANAEAKCLVEVSDNQLLPQIVTNIGASELALIKGDDFAFEYSVYYNKKLIDVDIAIQQEGESNVVTLADNKITANNYGEVSLVLSGEWSGMKVMEVIDVYVVADMVASVSNEDEVIIYNDVRAGETSITLVPSVIENGVELSVEQIQVVGCEYDENVVSYDNDTLAIRAEKKGSTEVITTLKSLVTGNTILTSLNVTVDLYNEERSGDIRLHNGYQTDETYSLYLDEIFADMSEEEYQGLKITYVADVTKKDGAPVDMNVVNGKVDISKVSERQLLGDRKWYVECEKFARTVAITVETQNFEKHICGVYLVEESDFIANWKNVLTLSQLDGVNRFTVSDPDTEEVKDKGTYIIKQYNKEEIGGRIILKYDGSQTKVFGYYWQSGGVIYMDVRFGVTNYAVSYYRENTLPYEALAGEYTCANWAKQTFVLNADGTCVFDKDNNLQANQTGEYTITPSGMTSGVITMTFEIPYKNQTTFYCNYQLKDGKYSFTVTESGKNYTYTQKTDKVGPYTAMAGYYSTPRWLSWKLNADGTVVFDWRGTEETSTGNQKVGTYTLTKTDETSGTIKFVFTKDYCGYKEHEGEYYINEQGKYVFIIKVVGSDSSVGDMQTFTQQIDLIKEK